MSLSYIRNDRRVRQRIVGEDADFPHDTWGSLEDGTVLMPSTPVLPCALC